MAQQLLFRKFITVEITAETLLFEKLLFSILPGHFETLECGSTALEETDHLIFVVLNVMGEVEGGHLGAVDGQPVQTEVRHEVLTENEGLQKIHLQVHGEVREDKVPGGNVRIQSHPLPPGDGVTTSLPDVVSGLLILKEGRVFPLCSPVGNHPVDEMSEVVGDPPDVDYLLNLVLHVVKDFEPELSGQQLHD